MKATLQRVQRKEAPLATVVTAGVRVDERFQFERFLQRPGAMGALAASGQITYAAPSGGQN
jgi:hypothetical protein